jgi:hypothetical protein
MEKGDGSAAPSLIARKTEALGQGTGRADRFFRAWGTAVDPKILAFSETDEGQRADLKTVSSSA